MTQIRLIAFSTFIFLSLSFWPSAPSLEPITGTAAQAAPVLTSRAALASAAESAYLSGETARQTLIVKVLDPSEFQQRYGHRGYFAPFTISGANTHVGTLGYFKLHQRPTFATATTLLQTLAVDPNIEYAYFEPRAHSAVAQESTTGITKAPYTPELATPHFESKQTYLEASPVGVGARAAWNINGGAGEYVKVVDIEVCWDTTHEDFAAPYFLGANPKCSDTGHGTAVWGEIAGKRDGKGVTGIAHQTQFGIYGFIEGEWDDVNDQYISSINRAIQGAMEQLAPGDVLVIEQHMVGPDSRKYTAVEFWPHIYEQLKAATERGIICVAAAGNGGSNFDSPVYAGAFDLKQRDSGCILVGAGDPQSKERLSFSNYGSRIDAHAFGRGVVTTAYGDAFNGGPGRDYTFRFSGTSSATPIVAGAVAVVSSIAKTSGRILKPHEVRAALRQTGVVQGPNTRQQRIGNLPNIPDLARALGLQVRKKTSLGLSD